MLAREALGLTGAWQPWPRRALAESPTICMLICIQLAAVDSEYRWPVWPGAWYPIARWHDTCRVLQR